MSRSSRPLRPPHSVGGLCPTSIGHPGGSGDRPTWCRIHEGSVGVRGVGRLRLLRESLPERDRGATWREGRRMLQRASGYDRPSGAVAQLGDVPLASRRSGVRSPSAPCPQRSGWGGGWLGGGGGGGGGWRSRGGPLAARPVSPGLRADDGDRADDLGGRGGVRRHGDAIRLLLGDGQPATRGRTVQSTPSGEAPWETWMSLLLR